MLSLKDASLWPLSSFQVFKKIISITLSVMGLIPSFSVGEWGIKESCIIYWKMYLNMTNPYLSIFYQRVFLLQLICVETSKDLKLLLDNFFILDRKMRVTIIFLLRKNLLNFLLIKFNYQGKKLHELRSGKNTIACLVIENL